MSGARARGDGGARRCLGAFVAAVAVAACERENATPSHVEGKLPPGVAAEVGRERVVSATVERVARTQGLPPSAAREAAISDALFAARARELEDPAALAVAERSALSRAFLEQVRREVAAPPITDAEIEAVTKDRWPELDRPVTVRTTHALVRMKDNDDATKARAVAERLAAVLRGAASAQEFIERARAFDAKPFEVIAEALEPATRDGRAFDPAQGPHGTITGSYVEDYTRAAHALASPGDQSPVTKTRFGFHVIRLEERLPEARVPLSERRVTLAPEVLRRRAKRYVDELLAKGKAGGSVEMSRAAEELTSRVRVAP
jgi:peptidyl-prolyl cis-trans isomerase C